MKATALILTLTALATPVMAETPVFRPMFNGTEILNANLDELAKAHPKHKGVQRRSGHLAFLGHGNKVAFRKIRIAETQAGAESGKSGQGGVRAGLNAGDSEGGEQSSAKERRTQNAALVFMVAGQSNAGGCGIYSPEMHKELGRDKKRPLVPGTTAAEVGLPTDAADYTHSYIWMPGKGFERLDPMVNTRPPERGLKMHGMELPVVHRLEKRFPDNDIYVIKHGPSGRNLHHDWNPGRNGGHYARWLDSCRKALAQLSREYPEVRVIGLYWDQGESDTAHADAYAGHLTDFIARFREDSGLPELKVFIRKHLYDFANIDMIVAAQEAVVKKDTNCFLLDIDLGSAQKNGEAWSYSPNNIHLNSKAFVELARMLMEDVLQNPEVGSFELFQSK